MVLLRTEILSSSLPPPTARAPSTFPFLSSVVFFDGIPSPMLPSRDPFYFLGRAVSLVDLQRGVEYHSRTVVSFYSSPPLKMPVRAPSHLQRHLFRPPTTLAFPSTLVDTSSSSERREASRPIAGAASPLGQLHEETQNPKVSLLTIMGLAQYVYEFVMGLGPILDVARSSPSHINQSCPSPNRLLLLMHLWSSSGVSADDPSLRVLSIFALSLFHNSILPFMEILIFRFNASEGFLAQTKPKSYVSNHGYSIREGFLSMLKKKSDSSVLERTLSSMANPSVFGQFRLVGCSNVGIKPNYSALSSTSYRVLAGKSL